MHSSEREQKARAAAAGAAAAHRCRFGTSLSPLFWPLGANLVIRRLLAYLGCLQVSYVEAGQRYGIIEAVIHLVNRDFVALADLYKRLGFIPQDQVRSERRPTCIMYVPSRTSLLSPVFCLPLFVSLCLSFSTRGFPALDPNVCLTPFMRPLSACSVDSTADTD